MAKKIKKTKNNTDKKISFLVQRKTINDKFFDLVATDIKSVADKKGKFKKVGTSKLAKKLNIQPSTLTKYIKRGFINEDLYYLTRRIEDNFKKLKIKSSKKVTKKFFIHTFTEGNFFKTKNFKQANKNEQFYFRAGLYIRFRSGKNGFYTIQNFPVSHYSNKYPKGHYEFYEIIKRDLANFPSMLYFLFNYFDVQKIDTGDIVERTDKFKAKHSKNIKNNKKRNVKKKKA